MVSIEHWRWLDYVEFPDKVNFTNLYRPTLDGESERAIAVAQRAFDQEREEELRKREDTSLRYPENSSF